MMTSEATQVLDQLKSLGLSVQVVDDKIRVTPGGRIPPDLARKIREHKPAIIETLNSQVTLGVSRSVFEEILQIVPDELAQAVKWAAEIFPGATLTGFQKDEDIIYH